jgi:hypothetical protein
VAAEFLKNLGLNDEEYRKLAALGASTPAAILAIRRAAPESFDQLLGATRARELVTRLETLLTPEERKRLALASPKVYPLGAMLGVPPVEIPQPAFDIEERDRLFNELQSLRKLQAPSPADRSRIAELESRLNALLESR